MWVTVHYASRVSLMQSLLSVLPRGRLAVLAPTSAWFHAIGEASLARFLNPLRPKSHRLIRLPFGPFASTSCIADASTCVRATAARYTKAHACRTAAAPSASSLQRRRALLFQTLRCVLADELRLLPDKYRFCTTQQKTRCHCWLRWYTGPHTTRRTQRYICANLAVLANAQVRVSSRYIMIAEDILERRASLDVVRASLESGPQMRVGSWDAPFGLCTWPC